MMIYLMIYFMTSIAYLNTVDREQELNQRHTCDQHIHSFIRVQLCVLIYLFGFPVKPAHHHHYWLCVIFRLSQPLMCEEFPELAGIVKSDITHLKVFLSMSIFLGLSVHRYMLSLILCIESIRWGIKATEKVKIYD